MASAQSLLSTLPPGFRYEPDFVSPPEERDLAAALGGVAFSEVRMRGVAARRRTAHFGWIYGYESWRIEPGPPLPAFLEPLRARAAGLVGVEPEALAETLLTEYTPGAGIGWHRDAPMFGLVIGISLIAACRFRFRRGRAGRGGPEIVLAPRSVYVLDGAARWQWQHSIPPAKDLRYSITFRTLRSPSAGGPRTP